MKPYDRLFINFILLPRVILYLYTYSINIQQYDFISAEWLMTCSIDRPNEGDCFRRMFEGMFPYLAKGILHTYN